MKKSNCGFTLLEVLLAIILIAILVSVGMPIFRMVQVRSDVEATASAITGSLRRAEELSAAPEGDSSWGVKIATSTVTVFKGINFATRDVNFDEAYEISDVIIYSGLNEIVFSRFYALPSVTGTISMVLSNGESRTIKINSRGALDF